ncbi:MAG: glycoside hydrolase family 9 protein, partial [Oscillospiraceae bacterium]|nr:glycoside hydrolase family 9 protein [Oscillospiraceae bacterium]
MKISAQKQGFTLCEEAGYFQNKGVDVMAFDDIYPEGHQSGVSIIMHGARIATNGDIRFDKMPGQWHAVPKQGERKLDKENNTITTSLSYPDPDRMSGFNPIVYPGIDIDYTVTVKGAGDSVVVTVDLSKPILEELAGQICFLLELFPGDLFGKPWIMDNKHGVFPTQPNGPLAPLTEKAYEYMSAPYAVGNRLTIRPDDPLGRLVIESDGTEISLLDARMKFLNGWFVVSSDVPVGKTKEAIRWVITPNAADGWLYTPVVQVSQVGYHPAQPKVAVIELDKNDIGREKPILYAITADGIKEVYSAKTSEWGRFLRYNYIKFDFSDIKDEGLYKIRYKNSESSIFRIAPDVYDRGVWQPVLEYFLPVQMCHMRVMEKSRLWHGLCHMDDARMAPTDHNHFDGYIQGASTLTGYKPGDIVPGLNIGGWHDAGDDDLRVESQAGEFFILSKAFEEFGVDYDATRICQESRLVEIHEADGKNDILQQIEHGVLSVAGAYKALGRLYRGIIVNSIDQYVIVGDPAGQTDNILGTDDDRWVFTEDNPPRELTTAAQLACAARALKGYNDELSADALTAARELFENTDISRDYPKPQWIRHICDDPARAAKAHAATELYLTTKDSIYKDYLLSEVDFITGSII